MCSSLKLSTFLQNRLPISIDFVKRMLLHDHDGSPQPPSPRRLTLKEEIMKRLTVFLFALFALILSLTLTAAADTSATVNARVTALVISVSIDRQFMDYDLQQLGATNVIPTPASFRVTNNGSVNERFEIKGANTAAWTLSTDGAPGNNKYVHKFSLSSGGSFNNLGPDYVPLFGTTSIAPNGNLDVFLKMDMPTTTSTFAQQSAPVSVLATMAP
jgi:hypothetical protein